MHLDIPTGQEHPFLENWESTTFCCSQDAFFEIPTGSIYSKAAKSNGENHAFDHVHNNHGMISSRK